MIALNQLMLIQPEEAPQPLVAEGTRTQERDDAVRSQSTGTRVTIGLTAKCPYGLGPCWGGAYEALTKLSGVAAVRPIPNTTDSTAEVYLTDQGLPDLDRWPEQIARWANGSYDFRGVEVTITGTVTESDGALNLTGPALPAPVQLLVLPPGEELPWDLESRHIRPASNNERDAHRQLLQRCRQLDADLQIRVTGPLRKMSNRWSLFVRTADDQPNHAR